MTQVNDFEKSTKPAEMTNGDPVGGKSTGNGIIRRRKDKTTSKRARNKKYNADETKTSRKGSFTLARSNNSNKLLRNENDTSDTQSDQIGFISSSQFTQAVDHKFQIIIIGDRSVGKTCFLERFTDDAFKEESKTTIGIDFRMKTMTVANRKIRLQIWDTAGQERFNSITTAYYRNARGILLVYDVTRPDSYHNLSRWLELVEMYGRSDVEVAIVGNKADLPDMQVDASKARLFAEEHGFLFFETSAKESLNVETVFVNLIYKIIKEIPQPHERNPRVRRKTNINLHEEENAITQQTASCC